MSKKLFVGNLVFTTTQEDLTQLFNSVAETEGENIIEDVFIPLDRMNNNRPRGFAFVTVPDKYADIIIERFNNQDFNGREMKISEAREREDRGQGGNGFRRNDNYRSERSF